MVKNGINVDIQLFFPLILDEVLIITWTSLIVSWLGKKTLIDLRCATLFQLYDGGQCTFLCFRGVSFTATAHNFLSKPLSVSHIKITEILIANERRINPVIMTNINPRKGTCRFGDSKQ